MSRPCSVGHKLRDWARLLRHELPTLLPVEVRRARLRGVEGDCCLMRRQDGTPYRFRIRIDNRLGTHAAFHVLVHEYAHALAWTTESPRVEDHGPEWGLAMARIWTAICEE